MKEGVISQGFVRCFAGSWISLQEIIEFGILKSNKDKPYIAALGKERFDAVRISSDLASKSEAQAWMDYMMLQ